MHYWVKQLQFKWSFPHLLPPNPASQRTEPWPPYTPSHPHILSPFEIYFSSAATENSGEKTCSLKARAWECGKHRIGLKCPSFVLGGGGLDS